MVVQTQLLSLTFLVLVPLVFHGLISRQFSLMVNTKKKEVQHMVALFTRVRVRAVPLHFDFPP
jgi:hypothetical protein